MDNTSDVLSLIPPNVGGRAVRHEDQPVWWHGMGPRLIPWQVHTKDDLFLVYICGCQGTHADLTTAWNLAYDLAVQEGVEGIEDFPRITPKPALLDLLQNIRDSLQIRTAVLLIVSPWPIYDGLKRNPDVKALIDYWQTHGIDSEALSSYIEAILQEFQPGHYLDKEHVLIALSVALEPFKDQELPHYILSQLAKCKITETPMLGSVASFCLNGDPYEGKG